MPVLSVGTIHLCCLGKSVVDVLVFSCHAAQSSKRSAVPKR